MDFAGNVIKQIGIPVNHNVLCTCLDLICVATNKNSCHVLNPVTGDVYNLPESPTEEHMYHVNLRKPFTSFAFGHVASTGEYKVLRMFNRPGFTDLEIPQLCEVITIKGGTGQARWRGKQSRDFFVECQKANSGVVVNGVVYFLIDSVYDSMIIGGEGAGIHPDFICSFDLEVKEWREDIQGPISRNFVYDMDFPEEYIAIWHQLSLAELKGYLVLVYFQSYRSSTLDLWFLTDYETRTWIKQYIIQIESFVPVNEFKVKPLLVLDDGRIVIWLGSTGLLRIYDPRTCTFAEVQMRHLAEVGLYTGSLLSL